MIPHRESLAKNVVLDTANFMRPATRAIHLGQGYSLETGYVDADQHAIPRSSLQTGWAIRFVGRASLYGVAAGGYDGVRRAVEILQSDLRYTLAMIGCRCAREVTAASLAKPSQGWGRHVAPDQDGQGSQLPGASED